MNKKIQTKSFLNAEEVAESLGVSKPFAYKVIRDLNEELGKKGFITISGRVSAKYFEERFYGLQEEII